MQNARYTNFQAEHAVAARRVAIEPLTVAIKQTNKQTPWP